MLPGRSLSRVYRKGLFLLALFASGLVGCGPIGADVSQLATYDPSEDSFRVLHVFRNVRVDTTIEKQRATHYAYLANLWRNREDLLLFPSLYVMWPHGVEPLDTRFLFFPFRSSLLYVDRHHGQPIILWEMNQRHALLTMPDLDRILVTPGSFFSTSRGTLAYSHQITFPGQQIDALLREMRMAANKSLVQTAKAEVLRRRKGWRGITWEEYGAYRVKAQSKGSILIKDVTGYFLSPGRLVDGEPDPQSYIPLGDLTLSLWEKQDPKALVSFSRTGTKVRVSVTGAYQDIVEITKLVAEMQSESSSDRVRQDVLKHFHEERAEKGAVDLATRGVTQGRLLTLRTLGNEKGAAAVRNVCSSLKTEVAGPGILRLTVTIDLLEIMNCVPPDGALSRYRAIVASDATISASQLTTAQLRKAGIPVSLNETLEKVVNRFSGE